MATNCVKIKGAPIRQQVDAVLRAMDNTLTAVAENIKVDFLTTTRTWSEENQPDFKVTKRGRYKRVIGTDSLIYKFVTLGTKPHTISPKPGGAGVLVFNVPYRAKTAPMQVRSKAGGAGATQVITNRSVEHPGTDARDFHKAIADKWRPKAQTMLERNIANELRRTRP